MSNRYLVKRTNKFITRITELVGRSNLPKDWKRIERYMRVNGNEIRERIPIGKIVSAESSFYCIGIVIERRLTEIHIITYTVFEGKCVLNHYSVHDSNYKIKSFLLNCFGAGMKKFNNHDPESYKYLSDMFDEFIEIQKSEILWNTIE